jgi:transcriptional regulator with XRE-family HTH domain
MTDEPADSGNFLGAFIRAQRQMAYLSLRELAAMTEISNPYLSQIERWLSEPSARVLKSIAEALNLSAEALFGAGRVDPQVQPTRRGRHADRDSNGPATQRTAEARAAERLPKLHSGGSREGERC